MEGDTMNSQVERRKENRLADGALSPEFLAVLAACGGEIRETDKQVLAEREKRETDGRRRIGDRRANPR
jgi:hypothetical protein